MRNNIIVLIIVVFISTIPESVFGVDGYKVLKWNMTVNETKKAIEKNSYCDISDYGIGRDGAHLLSCNDFTFGGTKREAFFIAVNDKLLRVGIALELDEIEPLIGIFNKKYGRKSSGKIPEKGKYPAETIGWDKDTILLTVTYPQQQMQAQNQAPQEPYAILIYTSPGFESMLMKHKTKALEESISADQ